MSIDTYYSVPDEEELFPLSFNQPPLLSNSIDTITDDYSSSYQNDLLRSSPLLYSFDSKSVPLLKQNISKVQKEFAIEDCMFDLETEEDASIFVPREEPKQTIQNKPLCSGSNIPEEFANAAQQNYRLWLNSV